MRIDVVIPTKNGDVHPQLLDTLLKADWVQDISITQTVPVNLARKQAVSQADGEWVAMIDADMTIPSNWLDQIEPALTPDVGAVSSVAQQTDPPEVAYLRIVRCFRSLHHVDTVPYSNNMLIRKSLMSNGYKPCPQFFGEDHYLHRYIREKGFKWVVLPQFGVVHHGKIHDSVEGGIAYGKNRYYTYKQLLRRGLARFLFIPWAALTSFSSQVFYRLWLENARFFAGWFKSRISISEKDVKIMEKYAATKFFLNPKQND
jgi:glycosyltransferase involved in cell wall biosynthesis